MEYRETVFWEQRRMVLEPQMDNMKVRCERLYNYHSYCLFDQKYEKYCEEYCKEYCKEYGSDVECVKDLEDDCAIAEKFCVFLEGTIWDGDKEYLELYKAKAFYLMGSVYKERGSYDYALDYLLKAKKIIEEQSFQYVLPEEYARTCMYIGKCRLEKHYKKGKIRKYYKLAKDVLTDKKITEYLDSESIQKALIELALLQAITEMDIYEQPKGKKIEWKKAWDYLKDAEGYEKLKATENWKEKQRETFWTTKGIWYREFYLQLQGKTKSLFEEKESTPWEEEHKKSEEFMKALPEEAFEQGIEKSPERAGTSKQEFRKWAKETKLFGFKKAFLCLAQGLVKDPKNTICMGNMAAMLYHVENDDTSIRQDVETFLRSFKDEFKEELLVGKNRVIFGDGKKGIKECVEQLLDVILEIEHNNMYALSLKATMNESVESEVDYYPILRTSTLKKRFRKMDDLYKCTNNNPDPLQEIKIHLICLHSAISDYMNKAIVDVTEEYWKKHGIGHYTRTEVIPKLINKESNSKFRLQNVNHLNDPLEGVLLLNYLKNAKLAESGQGAVSDDRNETRTEQEKSRSGKRRSLIKETMNLYDPKKNGSARSSVYMGSFSCRTDDLNMWSRYGDDGKGCCIKVDADSFDTSTTSLITQTISDEGYGNNQLEDIKYPLYMVLYLPENFKDTDFKKLETYTEERSGTETRKKEVYWWRKQNELVVNFKGLCEKLKTRLGKIQESCENVFGDGHDKVKTEIQNTIMVILDLVRFLIKSDFYRDEREYRVIQYSSSPLYDQVDSGVPKLYINMNKSLTYKTICYGPCVPDFGSEATYVLNIKKEDKPKQYKTWDLKVCQSRISYRGKGASDSK